MYTIVCDVCKKTIQDPVKGKNYSTIRKLHLCKKCMDAERRNFQDSVESENKPYDFLARKDEFWTTVSKDCSSPRQ